MRYNTLAYDDRDGATYHAAIPPMTALQVCRHLQERLQCPHVAVAAKRGKVLLLSARWPDMTHRGAVAILKPGH
jgi:hypothetical protein